MCNGKRMLNTCHRKMIKAIYYLGISCYYYSYTLYIFNEFDVLDYGRGSSIAWKKNLTSFRKI